MRKLFKGEKRAFKATEIKQIQVPLLDELSVKSVLDMVRNDPEVVAYFPDEYLKKLKPDRPFFFNTINTIHEGFLPQLIQHA